MTRPTPTTTLSPSNEGKVQPPRPRFSVGPSRGCGAGANHRRYKYYTSARHFLQDITECSDLVTLQAMVFLMQFLQATGNLNGCHTLIGITLRSALRMGLHRYLPHIPMSPIQDELRRRVFHSIRQMDIYLCTSLGLPILLRDGDINQPRPTEVDDEYITEDGIRPPPPGTPSFLEAFNAHLELMRILADVVDHLYPPPRGTDPGLANVTYVISCTRVREIEQALHDWHEKLAETWRPGPEENAEINRYVLNTPPPPPPSPSGSGPSALIMHTVPKASRSRPSRAPVYWSGPLTPTTPLTWTSVTQCQDSTSVCLCPCSAHVV